MLGWHIFISIMMLGFLSRCAPVVTLTGSFMCTDCRSRKASLFLMMITLIAMTMTTTMTMVTMMY